MTIIGELQPGGGEAAGRHDWIDLAGQRIMVGPKTHLSLALARPEALARLQDDDAGDVEQQVCGTSETSG